MPGIESKQFVRLDITPKELSRIAEKLHYAMQNVKIGDDLPQHVIETCSHVFVIRVDQEGWDQQKALENAKQKQPNT